MSLEQELKSKLQQEFSPYFISIENESHKHSSGRGANSHFKVVIVSDKFIGMRPVARHRKIYQLFQYELSSTIHALALHTYTKEEWDRLEQILPKSTNCLGVGK
ncbi:BolA protein family transcriptional regulator [Bisgaardia hudsonensis]|uniref:BolA protein family transcriptional regulator n=1 Tax=Bisgaardia hudsonensis TaxID=109472 RepID=A0A4R2MSL7_9PAST|nr:BolA/IbaG family iron-sulfur metabolism protein [Bisgaardia hudsonensis]QLB13723.1 transcriptional regulator [Bisgaardia hudsonensis]TCP12061.1 BolA protein family transcriptional regulator [Bisgaardia hudsonensis]